MNNVVDDVAWQVVIRNDDVANMNNETKSEFISELSKAIQTICWSYGVHN